MPGWLGLLLWGVMLSSALAARLVPLTIEQLTQRADVVVRGTVRALEVARDPQGQIFTRVDLEVAEVWKGTVRAGPCRIVVGGGVLGEVSVNAAEQVVYSVNEEVVVYLVRNANDEWVTVGLSQGRFQVLNDATTGRPCVHGRFWGGPPAQARLVPQGTRSPLDRPLELEELRRRTREAAR
jgi:hypothetical protein